MIRARQSIGIEWRPDTVRVVRLEERLGRIRWVGAAALPVEGETPLGDRLRSTLGAPADRIVLGFQGRQGFLRRLDLPAEDRRLLRQLLEFDLDRHLPLPAEKLLFDFAVMNRGEGNQWQLLVVALPRTTLDPVVELLTRAGFPPTDATLAPLAVAAAAALDGAPAGPGLVIEGAGATLRGAVLEAGRALWQRESLPKDGSPSGRAAAVQALAEEARRDASPSWVLWLGEGSGEPFRAWARSVGLGCPDPLRQFRGTPVPRDSNFIVAAALAAQGLGRGPWRLNLLAPAVPPSRQALWLRTALAAGLLGVSLGVGLWTQGYLRDRAALSRNLAKIQRLGPQVQAVEASARRVADLRRLLEGLEGASRETSKLLLLRELTLLTPHDTWLTRLAYKRGEVELAGYSPSAQELIPRIEASPSFKQASFTGNIEREGGKEHFTIRARLRGM